jgi:tryptophan synthase alpha chain
MKISETFERLRSKNELAYMPYLCLGDPDKETSIELAKELCKSADGPVLHAAATRALNAGMTTDNAFECIKEIRSSTNIPIVAMTYANIAMNPSISSFMEHLASSGANGILLPDLPMEESAELKKSARENGVATIFMATPGTTAARLRKILDATEGYLYLTAIEGTTGARQTLDPRVADAIKRIRTISNIPVAVGFGISGREQAKAMKSAGADGAIVGSRIAEIYTAASGKEDAIKKVREFSRDIKQACF